MTSFTLPESVVPPELYPKERTPEEWENLRRNMFSQEKTVIQSGSVTSTTLSDSSVVQGTIAVDPDGEHLKP